MRVQIPINHASYLLLTTFSITIENFPALFLGRVGLFIIPPLYSFQIFPGKVRNWGSWKTAERCGGGMDEGKGFVMLFLSPLGDIC